MMGKVTPSGARMKKIVCGLVIALMICFVFQVFKLCIVLFPSPKGAAGISVG